ncbi:MAG: (d)CMP kinase [Rickettsiales bacterium]|jgi:cytidylate kinase|nr:(d)CMP kinase [Rickettsiales bacterium]
MSMSTGIHIPLVIAIDGPAASGKGTLARSLAERLGLSYLDTGKLYRAVGWRVLQTGASLEDNEAASTIARTITEADINSDQLYAEEVGSAGSKVSAIPGVRQALLEFQRVFAAKPDGAILDGRDIGTVICPDADIKFFVTADIETRTTRRYRELSQKDPSVQYDAVRENLQSRDLRDSERAIAPLVMAEDAVHLDTTGMDADTALERALAIITPILQAKRPPAAQHG